MANEKDYGQQPALSDDVLLLLDELKAENDARQEMPADYAADILTIDEPEKSPAPSAVQPDEPDEPMVQLTAQGTAPAETPPAPRRRANAFVRLYEYLIPLRRDRGLEVVRKFLFMLALLTLISAAVYLVNDSLWIPAQNQSMNSELQDLFHQITDETTDEERAEIMQQLYAKNNDFRAWISYKSNGNDFLEIDYPVVIGDDNDYYLEHDFNRNYNKNGTLFFDYRNTYTLSSAKNKVSIIYGHNMNSGQMFAHLNQLMNSVTAMRAAPVIRLDTFFSTERYKVFAVVLTDARASDDVYYDYLRVNFAGDLDFLNHVNQLRARSLYDFGVSVNEDDELLVLSTCTNPSQSHMEDGRLAVIARKVRAGENPDVDVSTITDNDNVIRPVSWYLNQELTPHPYYRGEYTIPTATTRATTTTTETAGTTTRAGERSDFESADVTTRPLDVQIGEAGVIPPANDQHPDRHNNSGNQGGNSGNQGGNSGNQGGNSGNQGGNSGNQGGNSGNQGGNSGNQQEKPVGQPDNPAAQPDNPAAQPDNPDTQPDDTDTQPEDTDTQPNDTGEQVSGEQTEPANEE